MGQPLLYDVYIRKKNIEYGRSKTMGTILAILGLTLYIPLSMTGMLGVKKEYTEREESVDTTTEK